jgi:Tfp pilus assembly protein PilF
VTTAAVENTRVLLLAVVLAAVAAATSAHMPVSTNDAAAQAAFDRGLFLYYAYNGDEAAKEFDRAARLDPRLAMAFWGRALADGPDLNTPVTQARFDDAAAAMRAGATLAANATPAERRLIAIMAMRFRGNFAGWARDDAAYRSAMQEFAGSTHDENVRLLAAEALLESGGLSWRNGAPADPQSQAALAFASSVLSDDPSNVMANHLCIHLYDLAPDRTPALACARRLGAAAFAPAAEHLAHMPAHYWLESGNYAGAVASSERAYGLLAQLAASDPAQAPHYAKHDVAVGYSAAMMLGNYAVAQTWAQRMSSAFDTKFDALTALRFGHYADAYAAEGDEFAAQSVRGLAALQLGRVAEARALEKRVAPIATAQGYFPQLFLARLAETDGKYDEAERWIAQARTNQQAAFEGELIPLLPADEALGDLRSRRGDAVGAIAAFTQGLDAYPNDPRALFGLAAALTTVGDAAKARSALEQFAKQWKGADTNVRDALL